MVWRDSVGVESSGSGLKIIVRGYFASEFSLLRHTDEPQKGRNSCLWPQTRYVLSSFGVLLMSCRVKFHVVRSALQYSACRIICLCILGSLRNRCLEVVGARVGDPRVSPLACPFFLGPATMDNRKTFLLSMLLRRLYFMICLS